MRENENINGIFTLLAGTAAPLQRSLPMRHAGPREATERPVKGKRGQFMTIRGKTAAAGVMAAGVALAVGGSAQAVTQTAPVPIGYTVTAYNAVTDSISGITGTFGTSAASVVGSTAVQVPVA